MATKKSTTKKTTTKKPVKHAAPVASPRIVEATIPDDYRPLGMWSYFGWEVLFAIPLIGWIVCIGLAFMAKNRNLRNFARSQFCWLIIYIIFFCVLVGLGAFQAFLEAAGVL